MCHFCLVHWISIDLLILVNLYISYIHKMDKIGVKRTDGRSKGATWVVKRSAVESGKIAVGKIFA